MAFNTETKVENKTGTTLQVINGTGTSLNVVVVTPAIVPTQSIYTTAVITDNVPVTIVNNLDQTKNLTVHSVGIVGIAGGVFRLKLTSGTTAATLFFQCYIGDGAVLNLTPEVVFPAIGGGSLNQFAYEIERMSGAGVPVELTIVYSIATPV